MEKILKICELGGTAYAVIAVGVSMGIIVSMIYDYYDVRAVERVAFTNIFIRRLAFHVAVVLSQFCILTFGTLCALASLRIAIPKLNNMFLVWLLSFILSLLTLIIAKRAGISIEPYIPRMNTVVVRLLRVATVPLKSSFQGAAIGIIQDDAVRILDIPKSEIRINILFARYGVIVAHFLKNPDILKTRACGVKLDALLKRFGYIKVKEEFDRIDVNTVVYENWNGIERRVGKDDRRVKNKDVRNERRARKIGRRVYDDPEVILKIKTG